MDNETKNISNNFEVTEENFVEKVVESSNDKPVIVDFWAPWCNPCKQMAPIIEEAVQKFYEKVSLAKINIDENRGIAAQLQIQSIPTVYAFYKGQVVDGFQGNIPHSEILQFVKKISDMAGPSNEIKDKLEELKTLVDQSDWSKVLDLSNSIIDQDQNVGEAYVGKVKALIGLNEFSEARTILTVIPSDVIEDKIIKDLNLHIDVSEKASNSVKDIDKLKKALKNNPKDLQSYLDLSNALFGLGKISDCYDLLIEAIKIDPNWNDQAARKQLIDFIQNNGISTEDAKKARRRLSSILFG